MIQDILIMPLTNESPMMHNLHAQTAPLLGRQPFYLSDHPSFQISLFVGYGPQIYIPPRSANGTDRKGDATSARAIVIYRREAFYKQNAVKTLPTPCSFLTSLRSTS